jgi:hypothetical protein
LKFCIPNVVEKLDFVHIPSISSCSLKHKSIGLLYNENKKERGALGFCG